MIERERPRLTDWLLCLVVTVGGWWGFIAGCHAIGRAFGWIK